LVAHSAAHQERRLDPHAFFIDMPAERHRTGTDAADLGMVGAIGGIAHELPLKINRRNDCDIWQMRPALKRIVHDRHIAFRQDLKHF